MLNVVTVHWRSNKWIEPQLRYLERNLDEPFRVFAALEGIDRQNWARFHYAADLKGTHPAKLNALANVAIDQSDPDDILMFIDGDAVPVRPLSSWMKSTLETYPLAAVRRDENAGDRQPHPCFSFTTCGFWRDICGDWRKGGTWTNSFGHTVTDVGGNLLHILDERGVDWLPLLRTNTFDPHPLWFAVYAHRVYHHGAGFRSRHSRADFADDEVPPMPTSSTLEGLAIKFVRDPSRIMQMRPGDLARLPMAARMTVVKQRRRMDLKRRERRFAGEDPYEKAVFEALLMNPDFYTEFDGSQLEP